MDLLNEIKSRIKTQGDISFADFMQQALYDPHAGYYTTGLQKFGVQGDFITAPELTQLFGFTLANACANLIHTHSFDTLIEFGAGTGKLCIDILSGLNALGVFPRHYYIMEVSGDLKARQQENIQKALGDKASCVSWLETLPAPAIDAIVIANEVLDAFPVHRFQKNDQGFFESFIHVDAQDNLCEIFKTPSPLLLQTLNTIFPETPIPYTSEVNLFISPWIKSLSEALNKAAVFLIDYGFTRQEYFHPDRNMGTLMCHYQQRAHTNPLIHIGQQDITAHVDFTSVAEAAIAQGFEVQGFSNQASFLMEHGLLNLIESIQDERSKLNAVQSAKILLQPSEMGELFKVIALTKNIDLPPPFFMLQDRRASL